MVFEELNKVDQALLDGLIDRGEQSLRAVGREPPDNFRQNLRETLCQPQYLRPIRDRQLDIEKISTTTLGLD